MININLKPYCQSCPEFEPCSEKIYADEISVDTMVSCEHMELCNRIEKYLKSMMEEKKDERCGKANAERVF